MAEVNAEAPTQVQSQSMFGDKIEAASKANAETVKSGQMPAQQAQPDQKPDAAEKPVEQTPNQSPDQKPAEKPADEKKPEGEAAEVKKAEESEKPKPPEKYELKLSDNSLFDKSHVDKVAAYAKAQGLSQDDASNLLKAQETEVANYVETRKATWLEQTKSDREIGGVALEQNVRLADRVLNDFATAELRSELNRTGYGNHPEMIRMLAKIGRASQNDRAHVPNAHRAPERSAVDVLYDHRASK